MEPNVHRVVLAYVRAVDAAGKRRVLYHGTSPATAKRALSEGLVPDPKKRSWSKDPGAGLHMLPRTSFPGIYLTDNLMTALSSARRSSGGFRELRAVIVVDVEEKTLVHDEDTLKGPMRFNVRHLIPEGYTFSGPVVMNLYDDIVKGRADEKLQNAAKAFLGGLDAPTKGGYGESRIPMAIELYKAYVTRQAAHSVPDMSWFADEKTWDQMKKEIAEKYQADLSNLPEPKEADRLFMGALRKLSDKLRPSQAAGLALPEYSGTYRSLGPIGFSGSNKIIAVVLVDSDETPYKLKFVYGNPDDQRLRGFFHDFSRSMTSNYKVLDKAGNPVMQSKRTEPVKEVSHA